MASIMFRSCLRGEIAAADTAVKTSLAELPDGPYFSVASYLDSSSLCRTDASCRVLNMLNRTNIGPWRSLGTQIFAGLALEHDGLFERLPEATRGGACANKVARVDWKGRVGRFRKEMRSFADPFSGSEITSIEEADEIAYFRCRLCTDMLQESSVPTMGRYIEVEVMMNPNNLSMAVVDFEEGGCSSVTFSPDTGAVIRESKVQESPRKVEGAYIQTLPVVPAGRAFHGFMGLYLLNGHLAFFRRSAGKSEDDKLGPWETTGFVSNLSWAEGQRLTPCLAFRDRGDYRVRISNVGTAPPMKMELPIGSKLNTDQGWSKFDWEGADAEVEQD